MDNATKSSGPDFSSKKDESNANLNRVLDFPHRVEVDDILKRHTGNIGFAQIAMVIIAALTLPAAIIFPVFGNTELPHRCRLEPSAEEEFASKFNDPNGDSFDMIASLVGPWPNSNLSTTSKQYGFGCERYKTTLTSLSANVTGLETVSCDNGYVYKYSRDQYPGGIINEWDLVCDRAWMGPFSTSMYMVGMLVGFVSGGLAGDRFGRRRSALIACVMELVACIAVSLSYNFWLYILCRLLLAFSSSIKITVLLVLCMEMTTARQRSLINGIWSAIQGFVLRGLFSPLAFWFPQWRWLHGISCMSTVLSFPLMYLFPESPRWLISQNRTPDAINELYKVYLVNQKMKISRNKMPLLSAEEFKYLIVEEASALKSAPPSIAQSIVPRKPQFRDTLKHFKNRKVARVTFQCILLFAGQLAITFGLLFYGNAIRANIYLVNFLNSLAQIPATIISALMYRYCKGRKIPIAVMHISSVVVLIIASVYNLIVKPETDIVLNICVNLALILITAGLNMVFMYVPELFVSEARTLGLGIASGLGRIGGVVCPFINALDAKTFHGLPIIIYIGVIILELVNLIWLPDTSGRNLQDNFEQKKDEGSVAGREIEVSDENKRGDTVENDEDGQPIWASTVDELVASTLVIRSDFREKEEH
ncbi:hypothetical protein Aperf_G00000062393 [Anoplocephala perfoliata]